MRTLSAVVLCVIGMLCSLPAAAEDQKIHATPAIWFVHGTRGNAYLLGSIHALPENVDWKTPAIRKAEKRADTFVFEILLDDENADQWGQMFARGVLFPFSNSLPSYFDADMRADFRAVVMANQADATPAVYLRPPLASLYLEGEAAGGANDAKQEDGVDRTIYADVKDRPGAHFRGLETNAYHLHVLTGDSDLKAELARFRVQLKEILAERHPVTYKQLLDAWSRGDVAELARQVDSQKYILAGGRDVLLDDRNRKWIPEIEAMLKRRHTYLITVGAAHLVGPNGVPSLLRAAGYRVDGP